MSHGDDLVETYFATQAELFAYFGYVEEWAVIPPDDQRDKFWRLTGEGSGDEVIYAETEEKLADEQELEDYYVAEIYTQRHLPKWVYRGEHLTMVCVDTHTDGNRLLMIFDNAKERPA